MVQIFQVLHVDNTSHENDFAAVPTNDHFGHSKRKPEKGGSVKDCMLKTEAAVPRPVSGTVMIHD
jgi:hypothetical protein